jgi:hypothetical protein
MSLLAERVWLGWMVLLAGCQGGDDTELRMRCKQQGLQLGGSELCTSWVNTLEGSGHAQFFTSSVLPSSTVTIHVKGKVWLARGTLGVSYRDRDGNTQVLQVQPGEPAALETNLRAEKNRDGQVGFFLTYSPALAKAARADGLVLELDFRQANFNLPGG